MISAILSFLSANLLYFILHLQNSNSFPKPLSPKEEKIKLEEMKNGSKEARDILIERNLRLVSHIVKKYYSKTNDTDDLVSIGTIGLIKGIDSFDSDRGIHLATYCSKCIENELLMHFRMGKKSTNDVYFGDSIELDKDGNPLLVSDLLSDGSDMACDLEKKLKWEKVADIIANLDNEREKTIICMRYGLNNKKPLTQREVAQKLGISRSYVSRIENSVLEKIRNEFND